MARCLRRRARFISFRSARGGRLSSIRRMAPEAFATDPDRQARFQREAQILASLNHPEDTPRPGLVCEQRVAAGGHVHVLS